MNRAQFIQAVAATPGWKQCPQSKPGTFKQLFNGRPYRVRANPLAARVEKLVKLPNSEPYWNYIQSAYYRDIAFENGQAHLGGFTFGKFTSDELEDVL